MPGALARLTGVRIALRQVETDVAHVALARGEMDLALTFDYDLDPVPLPAGLRRRRLAGTPLTRDVHATRLDTRHTPQVVLALERLLAE